MSAFLRTAFPFDSKQKIISRFEPRAIRGIEEGGVQSETEGGALAIEKLKDECRLREIRFPASAYNPVSQPAS